MASAHDESVDEFARADCAPRLQLEPRCDYGMGRRRLVQAARCSGIRYIAPGSRHLLSSWYFSQTSTIQGRRESGEKQKQAEQRNWVNFQRSLGKTVDVVMRNDNQEVKDKGYRTKEEKKEIKRKAFWPVVWLQCLF